MSEYEIGRDLSDLRCRVDRLESALGGDRLPIQASAGVAVCHAAISGVAADKPPVLWKPEKHEYLPPFIYSLLGLPLVTDPQFDIAPQSKTWTCHPEPLILNVTWFAGGSDEFYRFQNQSFTLIKYTNPNSALVTAQAIYSATLVASGRGQSRPYSTSGFISRSVFHIILRNAQGATLLSFFGPGYSIDCRDNYVVSWTWNFDAGLYDLVSGATWAIQGAQQVDGC